MSRRWHIACLALVLFAADLWAEATLPADYTYAGQRLERVGSGVVRYLRLITVYDAALYAAAGSNGMATDRARCLLIRYRVAVTAAQLREAAEKVLDAQGVDRAALGARVADLHAAYRDVGEGDVYALCHAPDAGTDLALNGERLGLLPGDDFAAAYFGIWLHEPPISVPLRESLLGRDGADAS